MALDHAKLVFTINTQYWKDKHKPREYKQTQKVTGKSTEKENIILALIYYSLICFFLLPPYRANEKWNQPWVRPGNSHHVWLLWKQSRCRCPTQTEMILSLERQETTRHLPVMRCWCTRTPGGFGSHQMRLTKDEFLITRWSWKPVQLDAQVGFQNTFDSPPPHTHPLVKSPTSPRACNWYVHNAHTHTHGHTRTHAHAHTHIHTPTGKAFRLWSLLFDEGCMKTKVECICTKMEFSTWITRMPCVLKVWNLSKRQWFTDSDACVECFWFMQKQKWPTALQHHCLACGV